MERDHDNYTEQVLVTMSIMERDHDVDGDVGAYQTQQKTRQTLRVNFVYCQPIFIILAHIHYRKFATAGHIVSPPNMVCVTALPCKILTTTFSR